MTFASFTTVVAVFENIIASAMELFHIERRRACVLGAAFILLASVPCVLGFNLWSGFQPLGAGSTVLDGEGFHRLQPAAPVRQPGVPALLRDEMGLGL